MNLWVLKTYVAESQDKDIKDIIEEKILFLHQKSDSIKTYRAKYSETRLTPEGIIKTEGEFLYKRGVGLKRIVNVPEEDGGGELVVEVTRGQKLTRYDALSNVVEEIDLGMLRRNLGEENAFLFDPMLNTVLTEPFIFMRYLPGYKPAAVNIEVKGDKLFYVFDLKEEKTVPPPGGVKIAAKVWVDRETGLLSKIRIFTNNRVTYKFDIDEITVNVDIPDNIFDFIPPEGVVISDATSEVEKVMRGIIKGPSPQ